MDSLKDRDFSGVPDEHLTPVEHEELKRRLRDFVLAIRKRHARAASAAAPKKRVAKWDPTQHARNEPGKAPGREAAPSALRRAG